MARLIQVIHVLALLFIGVTHAHNELLPAFGRSCFYEDMRKGDQLAVSFQVGNRDPAASEQLDADFWISNPYGQKAYSAYRVSDGDATIDITESGRYEYCFSNEYSGIATKDVTFHIHGVVYLDNQVASPDSLDSQVKTLGLLMQDIKNEQEYIVIRERTHRNTAESTNSRVKWWSILQLGVVVANSLFQIYYLKRFFEVKTTI